MPEDHDDHRVVHLRPSRTKHLRRQYELMESAVPGRSWRTELDIPNDRYDFDPLSGIKGLSSRYIRFVLLDQSSQQVNNSALVQPRDVTVPHTCPLELGHSKIVVGFVYAFFFGFAGNRSEIPFMFGFEVPGNLTGDFIIGQARLFESAWAEKAWQGIIQGTFTHVCHGPICPPLQSLPIEERTVIEVSLTTDDSHSYTGSRILAAWEA